MRGRVAVPVVPLLSAALVHGVAAQDSLYHESRPAMGTSVEIFLYAATRDRATEFFEAAFDEIERVEAALSTYRSTSEISRINASAARGPVVTDPEVFDLVARALEYSRRTGGAFDPTVGPLVKTWGFFTKQGHHPDSAELARARAGVGWEHVALDPARRTIHFGVPSMELDMGGIGKGFALDCAARVLRRAGVERALLGSGQSSYVAVGAPLGAQGWSLTVPSPGNPTRALSTVQLRDRSLSTSGIDQQYFEIDGRRYGHIIDPRSGRPAMGVLQVTVIAPTATDSDALSTALFVLGPETAAELVESMDGAAALLVADAGGEERVIGIAWHETFAPWGR